MRPEIFTKTWLNLIPFLLQMLSEQPAAHLHKQLQRFNKYPLLTRTGATFLTRRIRNRTKTGILFLSFTRQVQTYQSLMFPSSISASFSVSGTSSASGCCCRNCRTSSISL